jgi:hypothetical protein
VTESMDANQARWQQQKSQRLRLGDDLERPRPVDQNASFRSARAAGRAAEAFEKAGFTVSQTRSFFRTELQASREESLSDENVVAFLKLVIPIVESNGGTYDGFGGAIVT